MVYSKINDHENRFVETLTDSNGTKYTQEVIDKGSFSVYRLTPKGVSNYYIEEAQKKQQVTLHFTAGFLKGDLASLVKQDNRVSVPFLVARNGNIYELFDYTKNWAYHLGRSAVGGNTNMSKRTIAIEISNIGPLHLEDGVLKNAYGTKYCDLEDTDAYVKLDEPWRGVEYFSTMTVEQYKSLAKLINYLCEENDIPKEFLSKHKRYDVFSSSNAAREFRGISSHANYRSSGKWDLGPGFDWDMLKYLMEGKEEETLEEPVEEPSSIGGIEVVDPMDIEDAEDLLDEIVPEQEEEEQAPESPSNLLLFVIDFIKSILGKK
jgi:N-acetylmuramoyl-L-alanine amidase